MILYDAGKVSIVPGGPPKAKEPPPDVAESIATHQAASQPDQAAARLAARMAGKEFTKVEHYTAAIGELMAMHAEKENEALRRHYLKLLERIGNIHEGLCEGLRGQGPGVGEYVNDLGDLLESERKDLR